MKRDDLGMTINYKIMCSRSYVLQGDMALALRVGIEAVSIAEEEEYGLTRLNALFQLAAVYLRLGDSSKVKACLDRVIELSCRLQLFRSRNAARYLSASYIMGNFSVENMIFLLSIPGANFIVARFSSQILTSVPFALHCQHGREGRIISEVRFREMVRSESLVIWWHSSSKVTISGGRFAVRDLSSAPALAVVLDAFFNRRELSLSDVHMVKDKSEFRPERHGPACLALIHRLRIAIEPELSIRWDRGNSKYVLSASGGERLLTVTTTRQSTRKKRSSVNAQEVSILNVIKERFPVSSSDLSLETGLSRQTLHNYLKRLRLLGLIDVVNQGRKTSYVPRVS